MPVHGDYKRMLIHSQLAESVGVPRENIFRTENGTPEEILVQGGFAEVSAAGLTVLAEHVDETGTGATATQRAAQPDRV